MDPRGKRRLTYVTTAIIGAMIVILAVILLQQPIPTSTVPKNPTTATPPSITTRAATAIGQTGATLNGNLASLGTANSVAVGFQYTKASSFASMTNLTAGSRTAAGNLSTALTGLESNTTYYFRAWALGEGYVAGGALTFTTSAPPTTPGGNGTGNGHHVPPGWAHAACPNVPAKAPAHGVRARCEHHETYGQLKKEGSGDLVIAPLVLPQLAWVGAALQTSGPEKSGDYLARGSQESEARRPA